ncbi:MAG: GDSL-type esterase/lipase family protein [Chloroflexota bacterium]
MISILLNGILLWLIGERLWQLFVALRSRRQGRFDRLNGHFGLQRIKENDVIFLGDSITANAEWSALFPTHSTHNWGIGSDTTAGLLRRLDPLLLNIPVKVFLLIGTNDLGMQIPHAQIIDNYRTILERFRRESPSTTLFVQSILPRQLRYRPQIEQLNQTLQILTEEHEVTYIDLYSSFMDEDGGLPEKLSNDQLHLLGPGYQLWQQILTPYVIS